MIQSQFLDDNGTIEEGFRMIGVNLKSSVKMRHAELWLLLVQGYYGEVVVNISIVGIYLESLLVDV